MKSLAFIFAILLSSVAYAQEIDEQARVTVNGNATVYAAPDEVLVGFSIATSNDDIQLARKENTETAAQVIIYLKKQGIADKHIQTQYMRVGKRHRNSLSDGHGKYEATQSINICIDDMEEFENIMAGLLGQGVTNLGSPTFRTTELKTHRNEARKKAMRSAREKAELLAAELGQSIGKAIIIEEAGSNSYNRQGAYANFDEAAAPEGDEQGFAPGQLEVKANVRVSFELH